MLLEVLLSALILTVGVFALFGSFSSARRMAKAEEEWTRAVFLLEAGTWAWEKTGKWPPTDGNLRHDEVQDKSARRGTLFVRLSPDRNDELSLSAYR